MAISKRLRYEVLRRDNHTCRYCGRKAPEVQLTVDHVVPKSLGGTDEPSNLVAACGDCNGGKTSSSPDAPLVADVAGRALEWAQAMQQAQDRMLADISAREADRRQFAGWWDAWGIPKDPGWELTVDQFISAGLPLAVLHDCINRAMTRKQVAASSKFRYMCGIAWSKVTELQKAARFIASGSTPADDPPADADAFEQGRLSLATELLADMTEEERAHFLESADVNEYLSEGERRTEAEEACEAVAYALDSARTDLAWLVGKIERTLQVLPTQISELCLAEMRTRVDLKNPHSRMSHAAWGGLLALEDLIDLPPATAWTYDVSDAELAEWHDYARALTPHAELSPERWLVRAWTCAKTFAEGRYYPEMCSAPGVHISECPARGTHWAVIAELKCCGPDRADDHEGHLVCESHLRRLVDGTYTGRGGRIFTTTDFTEAAVPEYEQAPF